jgi:very-short-patch-repair endonuclease
MFYGALEKYFIGDSIITKFEAQKPIGIYIVDFYFEAGTVKVAVEIDGHEAHKTKEQRYKDYCRERFLLSEGIITIRFTGSEVFVDADKCASETMKLIEKIYDDVFEIEDYWFAQGLMEGRSGK